MKKPSISELIDLLNKPALISWANKQGLMGVDVIANRVEKMNRGTSMHAQIENFILNGECLEVESHQKGLINFLADKEVLHIEKKIETEWFTGRIDCILKHNGETVILDWKSKAKRVYLENKLQLVAYGLAERCDSFGIVSVPNFQYFPLKIENRAPYEKILKNLSAIYYAKKEIEHDNKNLS
jgi:hypothetical protein